MQKAKRKGKAAAEAAAFPVMEESKMETIILYHRKRKPPRITRGGPDHAVNTNTILPILVYRYAPNYTPGNEKAALSARLSRKHPKITRHKERRIKTIIGSLFPLSTEKPPGRLIPRRHMQFPTQPPKRLVDTSKMLAAHAPNPWTRAATTRRGDHTIPA